MNTDECLTELLSDTPCSCDLSMNDSLLATELFNRWQAGDQEAAGRLFEWYSNKLRALAGRNLSDRLRRRVEPDDVVQSALRTFFRKTGRGAFHIDTSADLWRLLVSITVAKARAHARRHTAAKRDVRAEASASGEAFYEAITNEPGPPEAAVFADLVETVLEGLPDGHGEILAMCLQGYTRTDTAKRLGVSRQTVHRVLALLKERLERIAPERSWIHHP